MEVDDTVLEPQQTLVAVGLAFDVVITTYQLDRTWNETRRAEWEPLNVALPHSYRTGLRTHWSVIWRELEADPT